MIQGSGEEYNSHGEHVVEIPLRGARRLPTRRSFAGLGVALGLALLGAGIAGVIAHDNSVRARTEAVQREALKNGWSTLAALATQGAQREPDPQANLAQPQPAAAVNGAPSTVVVVNVPAPGSPAPGPSSPVINGTVNGSSAAQSPYGSPGSPVSAPYPSGPNSGSPSQGSTVQGVPVPIQFQGGGNGTFANYPYTQGSNGTVADASANQGLVGTVPASGAIPNIPNGTVSASPAQPPPNGSASGSNINQSVSNGTIPGAPVNGAPANGAAPSGAPNAATANGPTPNTGAGAPVR